MSIFLRIDINLIAFFILGIIYIMASRRLDSSDPFNHAYLKIVPIILVQLILESLSCIVNGIKSEDYFLISYMIHICLYMVGAILGYKGYILIRKLIIPNQIISKKRLFFLKLPLAINTILIILSPIFKLIFYITKDNVYHRGDYFIISILAVYFYLFCILFLILKNKSRLGEHEFTLLVVFCLLPIIGGLLQTLYYGALLMWSSVAFALVVMFSYLQQRMVHLDYLTGVWNRGSFEFYIRNRLANHNSETLGIIYCDIDGLKEINDKYGHLEGDGAIKDATKIIKNSIRKTDIMVRMGGDEFIIVLECETADILNVTLERIDKAFLDYNRNSTKNYELSCSFGWDMLNSDYDTIDQFIHHVDTLMYENKKSKKGVNH